MRQSTADFIEWLRQNTKLSEGSMRKYGQVIQLFLDEYKAVNLKNIKTFISTKNRKHNEMHIRAPFRHYFLFKGMPMEQADKLYEQLPGCKQQPKKRFGNFVTDDILFKVIGAMDNPIYRDISMLRHYTGMRIFESFILREENISKAIHQVDINGTVTNVKMIKLMAEIKRGRTVAFYLEYEIGKQILKPYIKGRGGYLFMPREYDVYDKQTLTTKLNTRIWDYNQCLKRASETIGLKHHLASHDIRRMYADRARKKFKDIFLVKNLMHHSDIRTTLRYFDDNQDDVIKATAQMQGAI